MPSPRTASDTAATGPGLLIHRIRVEWVRALEQGLRMQGLELRFTQAQALKRLVHDGPKCSGDLARELDHDAGAMTRVIDQLVALGYVRRNPDAHDRRALRISATDAGIVAWKTIHAVQQRITERALQHLDPDQRQTLMTLLARMLDSLQADH